MGKDLLKYGVEKGLKQFRITRVSNPTQAKTNHQNPHISEKLQTTIDKSKKTKHNSTSKDEKQCNNCR